MDGLRGWWVALFVLLGAATAQAGTAGMAGVWDFAGTASFRDAGGKHESDPIGQFNFSTGSVTFTYLSGAFFGATWTVPGGTLTDNGDGTYTGDLSLDWGLSSIPVVVPWEITDLGNGTATVVTLDGDGDGVSGIPLTGGPFAGSSLAIDGTLTKIVPEPSSGWLLVPCLAFLVGWSRHAA